MIEAFGEFVSTLTEFVETLLPMDLASTIMSVVIIVLAIAAWRIIS